MSFLPRAAAASLLVALGAGVASAQEIVVESQPLTGETRVYVDGDSPRARAQVRTRTPARSSDTRAGIVERGYDCGRVVVQPHPERTVYVEPQPRTVYVQPQVETCQPRTRTVYVQPQPRTVYVQPQPRTVYVQPQPRTVYVQPRTRTVYVQPPVHVHPGTYRGWPRPTYDHHRRYDRTYYGPRVGAHVYGPHVGVHVDVPARSVVRQVRRTGRQIDREAHRVTGRVGRQAERTGRQVGAEAGRFGSRVGKEAGRVGSRIGKEAGRAGKRIGKFFKKVF